MSAPAQPPWLRRFAAYDARRDRRQARPPAVGVLLLVVVACAAAGLFGLRHLTDRVSVASVPAPAAPAESASGRPLTWQVWQQPDGSYRLPEAVQAFVHQDLERALGWWQANLLQPDQLEAGLAAHFSGPELAHRRRSLDDCRRHDAVGIVYAGTMPGGVTVLQADGSGRQVWAMWSVGERRAALYRLSDGALVVAVSGGNGSETVLPAAQATYRMVFNPDSRRWTVDELVSVTAR
jgi:hypothetical protein